MPNEQIQSSGCTHNEVQLRQGTPEFEFFIAKSMLDSGGDLTHGATHLANLLSFDPGNKDWIILLEKYIAASAPNPDSLIVESEERYFSTEAVRAYIWYRQGRLNDALELLFSVAYSKQDSRYLEDWVLDWLEPPGVMESIPENIGFSLLSLVLHRFPEAKLSTAQNLRNLQRWARLSERFAPKYPDDSRSIMLRAGILRKAALFDEAEEVANFELAKSPTWHAATALGLIRRYKGDIKGAVEAFTRAVQLDPHDNAAKLEAADMFVQHDDWENALKWYQNVLNSAPDDDWAKPSAIFCNWKLTENQELLEQLSQIGSNGNVRAQQLYFREFGRLPFPSDATAGLLDQLSETILNEPEKAPVGTVRMTTSSIEAPSNYLAFKMEMEALKHDLKIEVKVNDIPRPDPRSPIVTKVAFLLWKYDGTNAQPALPPPSPAVSTMIAQLANTRYEEYSNWAMASWVADDLGPSRIAEILATMVHPPAMPPAWSAISWLPRVQLAAAQVAAQIDTGWEGSVRREALLSALFGPSDWTTQAAIRAMSMLGRENEGLSFKIGEAFEKLSKNRPSFGFCCWEHTLYSCWMRLPHLHTKERNDLEERLRDIVERLQSN